MTDTRCANGRDGRVLDARKALCGLTPWRQAQSAWRNSGQVKLYLGGTASKASWRACPDCWPLMTGRPAASLHKAADSSHRTDVSSEFRTFAPNGRSTGLHFAPSNLQFILIRASKRKSLAAVPPAGGALLEYPLTLIRGSAKCAAP